MGTGTADYADAMAMVQVPMGLGDDAYEVGALAI
jgi:hypothetical protein